MNDLFNCQKEENRDRCRDASSAVWSFEDPPLQVLLDVFALATRPGLGGGGMCWGGGFLILCVLFWCVFTASEALHLRYPTRRMSVGWYCQTSVKLYSPLLPWREVLFHIDNLCLSHGEHFSLWFKRKALSMFSALFFSGLSMFGHPLSLYSLPRDPLSNTLGQPWERRNHKEQSSWKRKLSTLRLKLMCMFLSTLVN